MRALRKEIGMVSVEWALTLPIFLLVALFSLAAIFQSINVAVVDNSARQAARSYSLNGDKARAKKIVDANAGSDAELKIIAKGDLAEVIVEKPGAGPLRYVGINFRSSYLVPMEPDDR